MILSYFTIVGISHHHQHSCPCLGADLGLREMFVIKSVRYSSALERTLPSPFTSSTDEEAVADGDNYDIADDNDNDDDHKEQRIMMRILIMRKMG